MGSSGAGSGCSFINNRVFRVGNTYKMTLQQTFEGDEEVNYVAVKGKNGSSKESPGAKALRSMLGPFSK